MMFSILAGVYSNGLAPLHPPRGIPSDSLWGQSMLASGDEALTFGEYATWYTLRELLEFDWQHHRRRLPGFVNGPEFLEYLITGPTYSLGDQYESIREAERAIVRYWPTKDDPPANMQVTNDQMRSLLESGDNAIDRWTMIPCRDSGPYAMFATLFLEQTIPMLTKLADPDDLRVVMYFS